MTSVIAGAVLGFTVWAGTGLLGYLFLKNPKLNYEKGCILLFMEVGLGAAIGWLMS